MLTSRSWSTIGVSVDASRMINFLFICNLVSSLLICNLISSLRNVSGKPHGSLGGEGQKSMVAGGDFLA
jgi:hypothetical protein